MTAERLPDLPTVDLRSQPSAEAERRIFVLDDMTRFLQSEAYARIEAYIQRLRDASQDKQEQETSQMRPRFPPSFLPSDELTLLDFVQAVKIIVDFLTRCKSWVDEALMSGSPATREKAFKHWLGRVEEATDVLNRDLVSPAQSAALPELHAHLLASFGSASRLDYGTGHELSFLCYLLVLRLVGVLTAEDEASVVRSIFPVYREVVARLQKAFKLEPAGKMGIWAVDAHGHLVYHFGASQSRIHSSKRPATLLCPPSLSPNGIGYLYLSSLLSPSSTRSAEDSTGLLKLYRSEVLQRLPVVQHLRFGPVLRWVDASSGEPLPSTGDGLTPEARAALDRLLDKRERDSGTVAPWALPALSGERTPDELLTRLPSPAASQPETPRSEAPPSPTTTALAAAAAGGSGTESPVPRPYSTPSPHKLGARRASRLSVCESRAEQGEGDGKEGKE
ncbi:hypothetical protein JCM8097_004975 [Rhodosporidiobolus ruineniae]